MDRYSIIALVIAVVLACLLPASPGSAQDVKEDETPEAILEELPEPPQDEREGRRRLHLELHEAVKLAILNNNNLASEWLAARVSEAQIDEAWSIFDPVFDTSGSWSDNRTPSGSALGGGTVIEDTVIHWDASMGGLLPTGMTYAITWNVDNTDTNNTFSLFNPQTRNSLDFSITQPLLRGAWSTYTKAGITQAEISRKIAEENFNTAIATLINNTQAAYWDLIFAINSVEVQRATLDLGHESVRITRRRYAEGLVPASDILTATAEVYRRQEELINAQNSLYAAEDALKALIFPFLDGPGWECAIVPETQPRAWAAIELPSLDRAIGDAFRYRPDLESARLDVESKRVQVDVQRNELLPQLDVVGGWTSQALDNELRDTYWDTLSGEEVSYRIGLHLRIPLGNRAARAKLRGAELQLQRSIENLNRLQNQIATEVRAAVRELHYLEQKWKAAIQTRRNTEEDHRAQWVKLSLGLITQFDFQDVAEDLVRARTGEFQAQAEFEKALSNIKRVQGLSFREKGVQEIVDSSRLRMSLTH